MLKQICLVILERGGDLNLLSLLHALYQLKKFFGWVLLLPFFEKKLNILFDNLKKKKV